MVEDLSTSVDVGKRQLLATAGALALGSMAPGWSFAEGSSESSGSSGSSGSSRSQYDAVVVGAGTAGMMVGIFASMTKANVLFLDKAPLFGGTLPLSAGQLSAAGTVYQKQQGIVDSPDLHYADIMRISGNLANPALVRQWADYAPDLLNWLAGKGYTLLPGDPRSETGHHPFTVRRYHASPDAGAGIFNVIGPIFEAAVNANRGIALQLNTAAVDLIQDAKGRVKGVVTENADGVRSEVFARNVILTSGGCAANPRLFADLNNVPLYSWMANSYSQGTGIMLGVAAGGYVWGRNLYIPSYGSVMANDEVPTRSFTSISNDPRKRTLWELHVNYEGKRFVREDEFDNGIREAALRDQKGHRYWVIYDQEAVDKAQPLFPRLDALKLKEAFRTNTSFAMGQTIQELAVKAGIDPGNLVATVTAYNDALNRGAPDPMRREQRPAPILRAPFHAVRLQGGSPTSGAGLAIDGNLRVIKPSGEPIPNLYAAGEVIGMGATAGGSLVGGSCLTPALTFGKMLGERIYTM
jgi:fumarate reductase flavoprotein subunit